MTHFFSKQIFFALLLSMSRIIATPSKAPAAQPLSQNAHACHSAPVKVSQDYSTSQDPMAELQADANCFKQNELEEIAAQPNTTFVYVTPEVAETFACMKDQMPASVCDVLNRICCEQYKTAPKEPIMQAVQECINFCTSNSSMPQAQELRQVLEIYKNELITGGADFSVSMNTPMPSEESAMPTRRRRHCNSHCNKRNSRVLCSLLVRNCLRAGCLAVTGNSSFGGNVSIAGSLSVGGSGAFAGNLTVGGTGSFGGTVTVPNLVVTDAGITIGAGGITGVPGTPISFPTNLIVGGNIAFNTLTGAPQNAVGSTAEIGLNVIRGSIQLPLVTGDAPVILGGAGFTVTPLSISGNPDQNGVVINFNIPFSGANGVSPAVVATAQGNLNTAPVIGISSGGFVEITTLSPSSVTLRNFSVPLQSAPFDPLGNIIHFVAVGPRA